ncbi:MAG: hypothetical protein GX050_07475 [Firmicutes bacterium]|nr:hypothetical protein [Bacillota bacterium]
MQKILQFLIGLTLLLLGASGLLLLIVGYLCYRYWFVAFYQLIPYLLFLLYVPLMLWLLITGIGVLARRDWARYSLQTLSVFLILTGIILITALNTLSFSGNLQLTWKQLKVAGTVGLFVLLILLPLFSLMLFSEKKEELWTDSHSRAEDKPSMYNFH